MRVALPSKRENELFSKRSRRSIINYSLTSTIRLEAKQRLVRDPLDSTNVLMFLTFIIVVSLSATRGSLESDTDLEPCTLTNFQKCVQHMDSLTGSSEDTLPVTPEQLAAVCIELDLGVKCVDKHSRRCFSSEQRNVYTDIVSGAKDFMDDLCLNKNIQTEFLKYAECYRSVSNKEHKCYSIYREALYVPSTANTNDSNGKPDTDLIIKKSCCALRDFVTCKYVHVEEDCGQKAKRFMAKYLGIITDPMIERHCAAYTFGSKACQQAYGNNATPNRFNPLQLFLLTLLFIHI